MIWTKKLLLFGLALITISTFNNCSRPSASSDAITTISPTDSNIVYLGRIDFSNPKAPKFAYTGTSIKFKIESSFCNILLKNNSTGKDKQGMVYKNYYTVIVDNEKPKVFTVSNEDTKITLKGLGKKVHTIQLFKRTEALVGDGIFEGIEVEKDKKLLPITDKPTRKIEFIGNSITCGYGNEGTSKDCPFSAETENGYMAYGAITARKLNADYLAVAYSGRGVYRNYDGTTSNTMSLIYDRIFPDDEVSTKWDYKKWQPDLIVLNLGTNDFAKGVPDSTIFVNTYSNFLKRLRYYYPKARILCTVGPMINDEYPKGAKSLTKARNFIIASANKLILNGDNAVSTFFFTPQGEGDYGCDWHPNIGRHEKMSEELIKEIKAKMKW